MNKFRKLLLAPGASIREALEIIDKGAMKIALVAEENEKLLGTITDGDIRRAILDGRCLDDMIEGIYYRTPTTCGINDSKEKILQIAVAHKLYQIPIVDSGGCIVGIAEVDELLQPAHRPNKVVIMAGGLGKRLSPLTDSTPKPMLHVGNKPILETIIESFSKYGYTDIILSVSYKSHLIEEYFGDGKVFGVSIEYIHESNRMGTAGALSLVRERLYEPFFVMNGDLLTNINFTHLHDFHVSHDAMATMAVREYDYQVPYGVVGVHDGHILKIEEKPVHKFFVNAGIYMLSPQVLTYVPQDEFFDMPTLFEKLIEENKTAVSFPIREYWLDIGRISDYEKANHEYNEVFG
jgi:dTDP-glucose pyrophosphorylase